MALLDGVATKICQGRCGTEWRGLQFPCPNSAPFPNGSFCMLPSARPPAYKRPSSGQFSFRNSFSPDLADERRPPLLMTEAPRRLCTLGRSRLPVVPLHSFNLLFQSRAKILSCDNEAGGRVFTTGPPSDSEARRQEARSGWMWTHRRLAFRGC